jgi:hypothetical protein
VDASSYGSPTWGGFFATVFYQRLLGIDDDLALQLIGDPELLPRGIQNCLKPVGVLRHLWTPRRWDRRDPETPQRPNHVGDVRDHPVVDPRGPALLDPQLRILLPNGMRRLDLEEWAKIKGLPRSWRPGPRITPDLVTSMGAHKWSALGDFVSHLEASRSSDPQNPDPIPTPDPPSDDESAGQTTDGGAWTPPDLGPGSPFFHRQMARLTAVTEELGGPPSWISDGEVTLVAHRANYGPKGPQSLVILWWNWPREHWKGLREGASMNFMGEPPPGLVENSPMTGEQLATAVEFVDELIALGVLQTPTEVLRNNFPLFLVEKAIPGEWRCIADGKTGGQNEVCTSDPVHLGGPQDILPFLYTGGASAVIDILKFFHMFPTVLGERKFMGLIHPRTGVHYWYATCPMGTGNSPGASRRFGNAFIRMLVEGCPLLHGTPHRNDFLSRLAGKPFNAGYGTGRIELTADRRPVCRSWIHVDDILLHGLDPRGRHPPPRTDDQGCR